MDAAQLHILQHALGLNPAGQGNSYRNHFVTGEGSTDYDNCIALVESGHMMRRNGSPLTGGDDLFIVSDAGKVAARKAVQT